MFTYRKYRVRALLTAEQRGEIRRLRDGQRQAYNWAVSRLKEGGWPRNDEYGLYRELTAQRSRHDWLRAVPAVIQRAGIRDAFTASRLSARYGRGEPKYRSRKRGPGALRCPLAPRMVDPCRIRLPCFGAVRARIPDEIMEYEPRAYEFVPHKGGYLLYVSCRVAVQGQRPPSGGPGASRVTVKGIDRGTVEPTVVVTLNPDGSTRSKDTYDTAAPFRDDRAGHQRRQSRMSRRMNRRSGRYRQLRARTRRQLRRVRNRRTYAECVAAKHIVDDYSPHTIVLESLNLSGMTRRGGPCKKGMNREMRFVRHHAVEQRIRNRAEMRGIRVTATSPHYTSQTCARCGRVDAKSRVTRDMFKCTGCHYIQHADVNAALNIGRQGLPTPSDEDTQEAVPDGGWNPFVRRELDVRLNCFVEGPARGRENQVPARHLAHMGMEKERQRTNGARKG